MVPTKLSTEVDIGSCPEEKPPEWGTVTQQTRVRSVHSWRAKVRFMLNLKSLTAHCAHRWSFLLEASFRKPFLRTSVAVWGAVLSGNGFSAGQVKTVLSDSPSLVRGCLQSPLVTVTGDFTRHGLHYACRPFPLKRDADTCSRAKSEHEKSQSENNRHKALWDTHGTSFWCHELRLYLSWSRAARFNPRVRELLTPACPVGALTSLPQTVH